MPVYVIALEEEINCELKVAQPESKSDLEARIEALEKKFYKLLESEKKEETESGPAEIRTQDLRRVKAGMCDICTVNDEPTSISPPFLLNEQFNQQNTDEQKGQALNNLS